MTVLITLTTVGVDAGPFSLYTDLNEYTSSFETGVSAASLSSGYSTALVPDGTTIVRVLSEGPLCKNYADIPLEEITTTTTTTIT